MPQLNPSRAKSTFEGQMYFQQFYLSCLAHASYMIGWEGIAAVVDPQHDVEIYLEDAQKHCLKIKYIIETHLHADFVSGHQELAARTGAEICVGVRAGAQFPYRDVSDGDEIAVGVRQVMNVVGGFDAWEAYKLRTVTEKPQVTAPSAEAACVPPAAVGEDDLRRG
jgi:glyoxylase-like metal-dependent hydrolase (beta-lactamase superfamily II)